VLRRFGLVGYRGRLPRAQRRRIARQLAAARAVAEAKLPTGKMAVNDLDAEEREQLRARIVEMRKAGATYPAIAEALSVQESYVGRVPRRHGLIGLDAEEKQVARAERNAEIIRRRLAGESYGEIEKALALRGHSTVHRVLARTELVQSRPRVASDTTP
jgi:hypothetical protein